MGTFAPIRQDEYPATDELQCIAVHIPAGDEYKALLAGFIAFLTDVYSYEDPDSAQADGVAATFDTGYSATNWDGCGIPPECEQMSTSVILLPDMAIVNSGAAVSWVSSTTSSLGGYFQQSPALTADAYYWLIYLAPGVYEWAMTFLRGTANGKGDIKVYDGDGSVVVTTPTDLRGAALSNAVLGSTFTLPLGGEIKIEWNGTGTSGATFIRPVQRVVVWKTADL